MQGYNHKRSSLVSELPKAPSFPQQYHALPNNTWTLI
jgi:hypothetical protein